MGLQCILTIIFTIALVLMIMAAYFVYERFMAIDEDEEYESSYGDKL